MCGCHERKVSFHCDQVGGQPGKGVHDRRKEGREKGWGGEDGWVCRMRRVCDQVGGWPGEGGKRMHVGVQKVQVFMIVSLSLGG